MSQSEDLLKQIFDKQGQSIGIEQDQKYKKIGLKFNPFPRSGTTNINSSDIYNQNLIPINEIVKEQIVTFISHALNDNYVNKEDKFISATITGNYGSGKTQLLMFVKYLLGEVATVHEKQKNPYVIYIDNPGVKLLEFIGSIISRIGEENFKKFVWSKIIIQIKTSAEHKKRLEKFQVRGTELFTDYNPDPYAEENSISYKKFLDAFVRQISTTKQRKAFDDVFKSILTELLENEVQDSILAQYFYDLIAEDFGVNKTWEALSSVLSMQNCRI